MKDKILGCLICSFLATVIMLATILYFDATYQEKYGTCLIQEIVRGW